MFFIGIITNQKNELYVRNELSNFLQEENIIFINDKNISNIKNVKFETIIIDYKIDNKLELRNIISNTKYVILNSDIETNLEILNDLNLTVITYGFNNKATFTVSSIEENSIIICLQRIIYNKNKEKIEPQEFETKCAKGLEKHTNIAMTILKLIYK